MSSCNAQRFAALFCNVLVPDRGCGFRCPGLHSCRARYVCFCVVRQYSDVVGVSRERVRCILDLFPHTRYPESVGRCLGRCLGLQSPSRAMSRRGLNCSLSSPGRCLSMLHAVSQSMPHGQHGTVAVVWFMLVAVPVGVRSRSSNRRPVSRCFSSKGRGVYRLTFEGAIRSALYDTWLLPPCPANLKAQLQKRPETIGVFFTFHRWNALRSHGGSNINPWFDR